MKRGENDICAANLYGGNLGQIVCRSAYAKWLSISDAEKRACSGEVTGSSC